MKEKIILLLLAIVTLINLSSCGCKHQWKNATCTSPKRCTNCGKTEGEALGHSFLDATCTSPKKCSNCGKTEGEALGHDYAPATYERPATCNRCGETTGEKLTPVSEWGFNYLDEMDNALVSIIGYDLTDINNAYVIVSENFETYKFENGYKLYWHHSIEDKKCIFGSTSSPEKYDLVNNDCLNINNGWDEFEIDERKTYSAKDNFVVFVRTHGMSSLSTTKWYIPYSLIDWEREIDETTTEDGEAAYKLYLIE